jgi:palmitoyltransferase ZDHHC2/15/20
MKNCAHRIERTCCTLATYFPLAFVYSLTTWAVWVDASIGLGRTGSTDDKHLSNPVRLTSVIGVIFYLLLNTSYTVAVFTDPGSPLNTKAGSGAARGGKYSVLPTTEPIYDAAGHELPHDIQTVTVSSSGGARFCKKCQTSKPDRTHHCSTCKRCVLKMDHHCPWLATCLGHRNYKAFVLFLCYTTFFCWACFASSGWWVWDYFSDGVYLAEEYASVNVIILAVVSGLIGLVLTGFTSWHLYLCFKGMTTIECLEKTRYLSGVRGRVERNRLDQHRRKPSGSGESEELMDRVRRAGDQLLEFHANAVPGASRFEEGEERLSPAPSMNGNQYVDERPLYHDHPPSVDAESDTPAIRALRQSYQQAQPPRGPPGRFNYRLGVHEYETTREQERYNEYLEDKDEQKMPNAFDLGWRRNLLAVFGLQWWAWFLPIMNSPGDGWRWEVSDTWIQRKADLDRRRSERLLRQQQQQNQNQQYGGPGYDGAYDMQPNGHAAASFSSSQAEPGYSRSATSLSTLTPQGRASDLPPRGRAWGGRYKKDIDTSGDEPAEFEVSGDDSVDEEVADVETGTARPAPRRQDTWERGWD